MSNVLITGATSGIGYALALKYAKQGHRVFACGRNQEKLTELNNLGLGIRTFKFDATQLNDMKQATESITNIDILILNAGHCEYVDDAMQFDASLFNRVINNNLISAANCLDAFMTKINNGGRIVFVSSSVTFLPLPRAEAYGASKAALTYLAESLRIDLAEQGIAVSVVNPGFVKTPLTDKNDFNMPCMITANNAAERIFNGINKGKAELNFPKRFTSILTLLTFIPNTWWVHLAKKMRPKQTINPSV